MKTMKIYKFFFPFLGVLSLASCDDAGLKQDLSEASIGVVATDQVVCDGNIITVKKGTPVEFQLNGNPNYITFFSGEQTHQYVYRNRTQIAVEDIISSTLHFAVFTNNAGGPLSCTNQLDIFYLAEETDPETGEIITPAFPGLSKTNYEADSVLVETTDWKTLVEREDLPTDRLNAASAKYTFDFPMEEYIGKKFTLALVLNLDKREEMDPANPEQTFVQSPFNFQDMYIETKWRNGRTTRSYAAAFGFTPLNMMHKHKLKDQKDYQFPYISVPSNTAGMWNFTDAGTGNFSIGATQRGDTWKYSWAVSDYLNVAECPTPDTGVWVKEISQNISSYTYTYEQVGTYTATFLMRNINYDYTEEKTQEFIINVTE